MIMTWHLGMATLETLYRSWSDEAKVPYGYGQHLLTGRSDVGQMFMAEEDYRLKNGTMYLAITQLPVPDIAKAWSSIKNMAGDDFYQFICCTQESPADCPNLGGPPLTTTLGEAGVLSHEYDSAGRGGNCKFPTLGHFHGGIKPAFARAGVRGLHGHVKFGPSDPIEMVNNLIQRRIQKYTGGDKDSYGRTMYGPQNAEQAQRALNWAIGECRADGSLRRCIEGAVRRRATGEYVTELYEKVTCWDEIFEKKCSTPPGTPIEIEWPRGSGELMTVQNAAFEWAGDIADWEKEEDARSPWLPQVSDAEREAHASSVTETRSGPTLRDGLVHPKRARKTAPGRGGKKRRRLTQQQREAREARDLIGSDSEEEDELNDLDEDGVDENATDEDDDEEGEDIYTIGGRPVMRLRSAGRAL